MVSPDKHKTSWQEGWVLPSGQIAYDLEGLGAGAGQLEMRKRLVQPRQA
ncbi:hypothetical protein [Sutcliffiella rhizosphaerae]|nr:hypothetical protein [Sutcliffiella rhizosphaerae]